MKENLVGEGRVIKLRPKLFTAMVSLWGDNSFAVYGETAKEAEQNLREEIETNGVEYFSGNVKCNIKRQFHNYSIAVEIEGTGK